MVLRATSIVITVATAHQFVGIHASAGMMVQVVVEAVMVAVVLMMTNEDIEGVIGGVQVDFVVETEDTKMTVGIAIISETEIMVIEVHLPDQGEADLGVLREDMVEVAEGT